jgi:23S rRNA pseudouridine2605 synthase
MTRLQKLLATAGLGSRRGIEQWIREGRVTVGGRIAQLGERASPTDVVCLDGRRLDLSAAQEPVREVLLYHKPLGELTSRSDPQGRPTIFDRLPAPRTGRWITVGRLDVNTSGLLLLTTDGELAHRLMHPSSGIEREYMVRVQGNPSATVIGQLRAGLALEDGWARFDAIQREGGPVRMATQPPRPPQEGRGNEPRDIKGNSGGGSHSTFRVVLHEGRNREVRRLWSAAGFEVSRLRRTRYGPIELPPGLRPGQWRSADAQLIGVLAGAVKLIQGERNPGAQLKADKQRSSTGRAPSR